MSGWSNRRWNGARRYCKTIMHFWRVNTSNTCETHVMFSFVYYYITVSVMVYTLMDIYIYILYYYINTWKPHIQTLSVLMYIGIFLFHPYTPLHFNEMIFPLVSLYIWAKPQQKGDVGKLATVHRAHHTSDAYAHTDNSPRRACWVWRRSASTAKSTIEVYCRRKTIGWCPCTPPSTMERLSENISTWNGSGK